MTRSLLSFILNYFERKTTNSVNVRLQPLLVGPPKGILEELFDLMTDKHTDEWKVHGLNIPVLLVDSPPPKPRDGLMSQKCTWDYAVTIRNSVTASLTLVNIKEWDRRPESIANAMETLGRAWSQSAKEYFRAEPWPYLLNHISEQRGFPVEGVRSLMQVVYGQTTQLESNVRAQIPWNTLDRISQAANFSEAVRAAGLPALGSVTGSLDAHIRNTGDTLRVFADYCLKEGLAESQERLTEANERLGGEPGWQDVSEHLSALFAHLQTTASNGTAFHQCPIKYFAPHANEPWWSVLTYQTLKDLLDEAGATGSGGKLTVDCSNALFQTDLPDEPFVVDHAIDLKISSSKTVVIPDPKVVRLVGKSSKATIPTPSGLGHDPSPPDHDRPIKYQATATGFKAGDAKVVSLATFGCRGYGRIEGALKNPAPSRRKAGEPYKQEIRIARSGPTDVIIYRSSDAVRTRIKGEEGPLDSNDNPATFSLTLEDGDELVVEIYDLGDAKIGSWTISVGIEEGKQDEPSTRFESLVYAHQSGKRPATVRVKDSFVRRLERSYLEHEGSWRGLVACWKESDEKVWEPDWSDQSWGDVFIPALADVRLQITEAKPPSQYLTVRNQIRSAILATKHSLGELNFSDPKLEPLINKYVEYYSDWVTTSPEAAVWTDCIAIHAGEFNSQAGAYVPSGEPIALLLSPLHPLRLAWHTTAQRVLMASGKRCPAAGLLDPHSSPGILGLPLYTNATFKSWAAYFAGTCNEPHWLLLWHQRHLNRTPQWTSVIKALQRLGFEAGGITGGFTETQTKRALSDIQGVLSVRSTLRIGLVGSGSEATGTIKGLVDWCRVNFSPTAPGQPRHYPIRCDIYDFRTDPVVPSAAEIAELSEETGERVRWFYKEISSSLHLDLVILDQLDILEAKGVKTEGRSPVADGALTRLHLRQDLGNAQILREARVGTFTRCDKTLASSLAEAIVRIESLATRTQESISHLEFRPNSHAISERLRGSWFVAVASDQVDPACFIRGSQQDGAYLWDFELPGTLGFEEGRGGYYLIADPPEALTSHLAETTKLVTKSPVSVPRLIEAIAMRGIPMLKRMAAGGSYSRGELGIILAAHFLQDVFRPVHSGVRLPVVQDNTIHFILPVDSYWHPWSELGKALEPALSGEHPDLIVFAIRRSSGTVCIKVTPVEVKFRDKAITNQVMGEALKQAKNLGKLLRRLWSTTPENELWAVCTSTLLAQAIDQCFRIYSNPSLHGLSPEEWSQAHEQVVASILRRTAEVAVNPSGRLLVFDMSQQNTEVIDLDGDSDKDTMIVSKRDAAVLLTGEGSLSPTCQEAIESLQVTFNAEEAPISAPRWPLAPTGIKTAESIDSQSQEGAGKVPTEGAITHVTGENDPPNGTTSTQPSLIPAHIRQRVKAAFESFIGNEAAVKRASNDLLRALIEEPPYLAKNYLFTGQPSTGKTELARRMANALQLPFVPLDGRGLTSRERLFELIRGELGGQGVRVGEQAGLPVYEYPPFVVFIDEVHLVPRAVQESLLTMLEAADRTVTLVHQVAKVNRATFLFATTRSSEIDGAFRTRCAEIQLQEYEISEVAEILKRKFPRGWPDEIYDEIARLGRCVPRVALELADELDTEITVSEHPTRALADHLREVMRTRGIDNLGLHIRDRQYLELLMQEQRPLGEQTIINLLGTVDRDRVVDEIEPYLRRLGFIKLGQRGREITDTGQEYVLSQRRSKG